MSRYLLDTSPLTAYLMGYRRATGLLSPWISSNDVATSILVYGEAYEFIRGFADFPAMHTQLQALLSGPIPVYNLTFGILGRYADMRRTLRPSNSLIGDVDTLIAATALEYRLTVVTANQTHFQKVPGLNVMPF